LIYTPVKSKIIRDPIHGDIKIGGVFLDLIEAPEVQRLLNIKQLGFTHLVFPGAHHTRLEHSLGTYYLAYKVADSLKLKDN
jgi:HD superfamily phosphohydrolase